MKKALFRTLLVLTSIVVITPQTFAASLAFPIPVEPNIKDSTVKQALHEFQNLSSKEKKERVKEAKMALKKLKAEKRTSLEPIASKALQIIFAILLPPLGVYLHEGDINSRFWISILLTLLFYFPGMIYALIIVLGD